MATPLMRRWLELVTCICMVSNVAGAATLYVQAGAPHGGVGSKDRPLSSLAEAQQRSRPGDRLLLLPGRSDTALEGGIILQPRQQLIGGDAEGKRLARGATPVVRIASGAGSSARALVEVTTGTEIAGIHFDVSTVPALVASSASPADPFSRTAIHDNVFTGQASEDAEVVYAIDLDALKGSVEAVQINDNVFRDGGSLGGVRVSQRGKSRGAYRFQRNRFTNLGGRAYYVLTTEDSEAITEIIDSSADNIGRGNRNSDSILPYLMARSRQTLRIRNYRYSNTGRVGNASNTGLELWIFGGRGDDRSTWCTACTARLEIDDSSFEGAASDGIQLTNYGSNTLMDVTIRNTRVTRATPRQAGGAISLIAENTGNSGSRSTLKVEGCDLSDSSQYAIVVLDRTPGSSAVVDLGGGALGSRGRNRFSGAKTAALKTEQISIAARNNWWGEGPPTFEIAGGDTVSVETAPLLSADPAR